MILIAVRANQRGTAPVIRKIGFGIRQNLENGLAVGLTEMGKLRVLIFSRENFINALIDCVFPGEFEIPH